MVHNAPYGCPVCDFRNENEERVREHMAEKAGDKKHQDYDVSHQE